MAGFGEVRSVLSRVDWTWLAAMAGALCVSFAGYHAAYRGIYRAEGGFRLPRGRLLAVVMAGFSGFFADGGRTPDDLALQQAGANPRESYVRAGMLGKDYAKEAETESEHHLHLRVAGIRGGNELTAGPWRISLESVDGWALRAGEAAEQDKGPFARLLGTP